MTVGELAILYASTSLTLGIAVTYCPRNTPGWVRTALAFGLLPVIAAANLSLRASREVLKYHG